MIVNSIAKSGRLFCFCGPVASGKSTICQKIVDTDSSVRLSVSSTTRAPRMSAAGVCEVEGSDYFFLSREEFLKRVDEGKFIEHAEFNGNLYGTELRSVDDAFLKSYDLLLDIEVQGVSQLKKIHSNSVVTIFVIPPSIDILVKRLRNRKTDSEEEIDCRIEIARREIDTLTSNGFSDYVIVNNDLNTAVADALSILRSYKLRASDASLDLFKRTFWGL